MSENPFEPFCRREYPAVVRTAFLITGDREEAADVAQEAFARAYERWRSVSRMERPDAWVRKVAGNLAISWRRRRRFVADLAAMPDQGAMDEAVGPDEEMLEALKFLTPNQRVAVVLRYYADRSVDDVATTLKKKPGTVRALTSQGLARLREFLGQEENDDARA